MKPRRFVPFPGMGALADKMQDLLRIILGDLQDDRVSNASLVANVTLGAGVSTPIYHGLGQAITTWDIVRQNADARVWEGATSPAPNSFFNLTASGPVTVTVRCC